MKTFLCSCLTLVVGIQLSLAQSQKPEVFASVGDITDKRSSGNFAGDCTVEIKFTGDTVATASTVREVRITKAIDETGRDLKSEKEHFSGFSDMSRSGQTVLKKRSDTQKPL